MITDSDITKRPPPAQQSTTNEAFTRIDLLALIATCCFVIPLLTHASAKSEEDIRRVQCRNNLKQISNWLTLYAMDNNDDLPSLERAGNWGWDTSRALLDSAASYGVEIESFYCPSSSVPTEGAKEFQDFREQFAVTSYLLTTPTTPSLASTNVNEKIYPEPITIKRETYLPRSSERELATDAILSGSLSQSPSDTTEVIAGASVAHRTSHLSHDGAHPFGGNILFMDGSVYWRSFEDGMTARTTSWAYFWY